MRQARRHSPGAGLVGVVGCARGGHHRRALPGDEAGQQEVPRADAGVGAPVVDPGRVADDCGGQRLPVDRTDVGSHRGARDDVAIDRLAGIGEGGARGGHADLAARVGRGVGRRQGQGVRTDEAGRHDVRGRQGRRRGSVVGLGDRSRQAERKGRRQAVKQAVAGPLGGRRGANAVDGIGRPVLDEVEGEAADGVRRRAGGIDQPAPGGRLDAAGTPIVDEVPGGPQGDAVGPRDGAGGADGQVAAIGGHADRWARGCTRDGDAPTGADAECARPRVGD